MRSPIVGLLTVLIVVYWKVVAFAPKPQISWEHGEVELGRFHEPGIYNYSVLLLSEDQNTLYVGAREAIFSVSALNISKKKHEVYWMVSEETKAKCVEKGKSKDTECLNYIRVLQPLSASSLYVCGTNAFKPICDHLNLTSFKFQRKNENGRGRCPFDPEHSYTSVMVDGQLYSGTTRNFLGSQHTISTNFSQNPLRTEYAIPWLYEPSFVYADVFKKTQDSPEGEDDKVCFFFTEVSMEYEFISKLKIPCIARVCKGDKGGLRILKKKWTSFLKAKLICSWTDVHYIFNILQDVFVLRTPGLKEPIFYGLFTLKLDNTELSAVCAYTLSMVEAVFTHGKYMQSTTMKSHTKWMSYNGPLPTPRPGMCINGKARTANYTSSLDLPDKTLNFIRDHPLINDSVTPIGNRPKLVKKDVKYTQIMVDRIRALDWKVYDVMFVSTDQGTLHKAVTLKNGMHIIEEIRFFQNSEPVQTLLLSSMKTSKFIYAGSNSGVVQVPLAFCRNHSSCEDSVLARDPYCVWSPLSATCVALHEAQDRSRAWIQDMSGNVSLCLDKSKVSLQQHILKHGEMVELKCSLKSHLAQVVWKFQNRVLKTKKHKYILVDNKNLLPPPPSPMSLPAEDTPHVDLYPKRMCGPIRGLLLALVVEFGTVVAFVSIPRLTWELGEVDLVQFHEPGIFNYSELLLNEYKDMLYVGAREAIFALNMLNISQKKQELHWMVSDETKADCIAKGRSKE
ncbi:PREDICTED: semaphorin-4D-like, partial [Dipodomys ordii]|uniref:Semaphorin-4D-like n=1 Tax=Dipodomys ordii TaxID=10020 RepID=A0A1S3GUE3_DIPOR